MRLVVHASQLRQAARRALDAGDVARALTLASAAQRVEWTPGGESLRLLTAWLNTPSAAPGLSLSVTAEVTAPLTPEAGEQL